VRVATLEIFSFKCVYMGALASKLRGLFGAGRESKIVIVGLSNAGKTTILYRMNLGTVVRTQPTIGSNVEEVRHQGLSFQVWDLGGQEKMRDTWSTYFSDTDAVVFVVDSNDHDNIVVRRGVVAEAQASDQIAKMELFNLLLSDELKGACIVIFANKQDVLGCRTPAQISEDLCLVDIRSHEWHLQSCCALSGEGLREGFDWIADRVLRKRQ